MTTMQELLDKEAELSNNGQSKNEFRLIILEEIKTLRGTHPPMCWGADDCSTNILITCPWRIDCNDDSIH